MTTLHALRRQHALSFSELAHLTGISVRRLAAFEYHDHPLSADEQARLAAFFGLAQRNLRSGMLNAVAIEPDTAGPWRLLATLAAATTLTLALPLRPPLSLPPPAWSRQPAVAAEPVAVERAPAPASRVVSTAPQRHTAGGTPAADAPLSPLERRALPRRLRRPVSTARRHQPAATPTPTTAPSPVADRAAMGVGTTSTSPVSQAQPAPAAQPDRSAPLGCPLVPQHGQVIVTQGYAQGTHLPTAIWGALDLAVAGGPTAGALVVATHAGRAEVALDSWPAGNYVAVQGEHGWRTAYAHLAQVFVVAGQVVEAGTPLGTVGSTGMATGPHLHYEIWRYGTNLDPSPLLGCR